MERRLIESYFRQLEKRRLNDGGFAHKLGGSYKPDATAWASLAFQSAHTDGNLIESARNRLMNDQLEDGRVSISPNHSDAYWPTPLAILAWHDSPQHSEPRAKAVRFLLNTTGVHWPQKAGASKSHDTSINGWPWIADTHSWVEPTALSLIALRAVGYADHQRFEDGKRMLLDRQLPDGGWNYGNTFVFGNKLRPMPISTGMALNALAKTAVRKDVEPSLIYLKQKLPDIRSPLSLGWGILGLWAWDERPSFSDHWIAECLHRQDTYGEYETSALSLILISLVGADGFSTHQERANHSLRGL